MMSGRSSGYPFTASQWQELEQQTLIYKYMTSGMPIPSELLQHMRRSYFLDSTITTTPPALAFAPQPSPMGWGYGYQMGFGCRKAEDPEPGRCRRTDGKKWRCSKEAYPDSKYCERHMHRGKNRSRKPVEMSLTTNSPAAAAAAAAAPLSISQPDAYHHLLYPYPPSSSRPPGTTSFHLDIDKDYRYYHGVKDVDQYTLLSEASRGTERVSSWEFRPLGMSSLGETRQNFTRVEEEREKKQQQHCFVLGADFNNKEKPLREEREEEDATHRPLRHFFDERPQKSKDSWIDLEGGGRSNQAAGASYSKTQLSISIPMSYHDTTPQYHNDD